MTIDELKNSIRKRIDAAWDGKRGKIDWLGLENVLNDIAKLYRDTDGGISRRSDAAAHDAVVFMDEAVAAFTGRGGVLPVEDWKRNQ